MTRVRPSRRVLMYGLVAAQLLVLAAIVAPHELNMALDKGPTVDVEILQAHGAKDPFRGAYVSGQSALDLEASHAPLPAGLRDGDRVLVVFAVDRGRRPRIKAVERGRGLVVACSVVGPEAHDGADGRSRSSAPHKALRNFEGAFRNP